MKIRRIRIKSFRAISIEHEIDLKEFVVIVGKNDAGKSTILKALNLFLNEPKFIPEFLNVYSEDKMVSITLEIDPEGREIIIDEQISTTFEAEELINSNGLLTVKKQWNADKNSRITADTYIVRKKYNEDDFVLENEKGLISLCEKYGIDTRKANNEEYNNAEKREKLRRNHENLNIGYSFFEEKIPTSGTSRLRNIGKALKSNLPRFEYFKADTSLSETDTSIQNFFKQLAVETFDEEIDKETVEGTVKERLEGVLGRITEKINSVVPEDEAIEPVIKFDWSKLVQTSFHSKGQGGDIPLSSRGDGFRRITMMAYFEYLAEQQKTEKQNIVFGFEEPETFLHPRAQENLFEKLKGLCENGYQVVLSTHSPIIVSKSKHRELIHVSRIENCFQTDQYVDDLGRIAEDLGITVDNQFVTLFQKANLLFLVEGIGDVIAFNHVSKIYKENNELPQDFEDLGVIPIPIGGCGSVKHWVNLDLLNSLGKPFFIVQDSDKKSPEEVSRNRENLEAYGLIENDHFYILKKRETENYIPCDALNRIVPNSNISYGDFDDVKSLCKKNINKVYLGGRKVLEKQFEKLTFLDIKSTFSDGDMDEFLHIYEIIQDKIENAGNTV